MRLAQVSPTLHCPAYVSLRDYVLPLSPFPCGRLSLPRSTTLHPPPHNEGFPGESTPPPISAHAETRYGASQVLVCISSYMPPFTVNSASPPHPRLKGRLSGGLPLMTDASCGLRYALPPSTTETAISERCQRSGNTVSPTACTIRCVRFVCLVRH